ncbi:hypothetical protein J4E86_011296 [Alternaria arbusti]|uniref:uncharacterized protein n=1 Tax=Alternaria arbusti TaxID=232088 RepID=UPI00221F4960|nr:uncharacterized protein J4E86_011296 [Alternaria arbusti]KAI4936679.1 hypothetical protein J4E86_011296 [Alternaria arbusti]
MPRWGRPPGGSSGVGRYYEGGQNDVHRFQELDSDDEKGGVVLDQAFQPVLNGKSINSDELYFNDMDISAWEGRAAALGEATYQDRGHQQDYDEYLGDDFDTAEYEEILFRRVLDKIRIARAAGNPNVSLSPEELRAYDSRLRGPRTTAVRPEIHSRPNSASYPNDPTSVVRDDATSKHGSSSRSKKDQKRSSIFGSKSKEKPSSRKRTSTVSTTDSRAPPPGFVIPGPDGQSVVPFRV